MPMGIKRTLEYTIEFSTVLFIYIYIFYKNYL